MARLQRLEERRIEWRAKRAAGEVSLTELMPLESEEERALGLLPARAGDPR